MFKNQYLITDKKLLNIPQNFNSILFEGLNILAEKSLNVKIKENEHSKVCLLGFLLDPFNPEKTEDQVLIDLLSVSGEKEDFFTQIENYSGRFILLYSSRNEFFVVGDAFHSRQINYSIVSNYKVITSSHNLYYYLFNEKPEFHPEIKKILDTPLAKSKECDWYGNKTLDIRFLKLLPNRYLNISSLEYARIPIKNYGEDYSEILNTVFRILTGTYKSIPNHYKIIQPLTSGWDSRILLGASLPLKNKMLYYIFSRSNNWNSADISLPKIISEEIGVTFKVWETSDLKDEFKKLYQIENLNKNFLPKTADIQFHYYNNKGNYLNINGAGGGVIRLVYGKTKKKRINPKELAFLTSYGNKFSFVNSEIKFWFDETIDFALKNNISILDLFYIENRMGNWGSIYPFEQDIAIEELIQFNNKRILYSIFRLSPSERGYPNYKFSTDLLRKFDERLLNFPVNPDKNKLKTYVKSNFHNLLLANRILNFLK